MQKEVNVTLHTITATALRAYKILELVVMFMFFQMTDDFEFLSNG